MAQIGAEVEEGDGRLDVVTKVTERGTCCGEEVVLLRGLCAEPASCLAGDLSAVELLKGVKDGRLGAVFSWEPDPAASEYHLNFVADKRELVDPRRELGYGWPVCEAMPPATSCSDADALSDPLRLIYYEVLSACGPSGADEGPF